MVLYKLFQWNVAIETFCWEGACKIGWKQGYIILGGLIRMNNSPEKSFYHELSPTPMCIQGGGEMGLPEIKWLGSLQLWSSCGQVND